MTLKPASHPTLQLCIKQPRLGNPVCRHTREYEALDPTGSFVGSDPLLG